ncbi:MULTISPECIES: hypothetical protein [Staphylococcus]|jgi:16S rRNA G527 N7-methylase RsmG|uniref:hypothetical protein n=1 Tax=Staphylococcus TaxID=1279 RepID=UPI0018B074FE|nr:hypothetical protein [Staphylococcus epidermidis]MBF9286730.1 hypothetical protein [Staphylococcus epidermidis]
MKFTHFELLNDINSEANIIGMTKKYERLCNIVKDLDQLIGEADNETKEMMLDIRCVRLAVTISKI